MAAETGKGGGGGRWVPLVSGRSHQQANPWGCFPGTPGEAPFVD